MGVDKYTDSIVDLNVQNKNGQTPLSYAAENGHEAVVKLLLESKDSNGQTPLLLAVGNGHEAVVKLIPADSRVDPNVQNKVLK
jgi:ankyrin repeat protein